MKALTLNECVLVSAGELSQDSQEMIYLLGVVSAIGGCLIGGAHGAASSGVFGAIGGGFAGMAMGALAVPATVIGSALFVGLLYQAMGLIDLDKMSNPAETA